jgi:hypothetical protein
MALTPRVAFSHPRRISRESQESPFRTIRGEIPDVSGGKQCSPIKPDLLGIEVTPRLCEATVDWATGPAAACAPSLVRSRGSNNRSVHCQSPEAGSVSPSRAPYTLSDR